MKTRPSDRRGNHCRNDDSRYVPAGIRAPLLIEVRFRCPFPLCSAIDKTKLRFHHIERWAKSHTHDFRNMIAACPNCHFSLDKGDISPSYAKTLKSTLGKENIPSDSIFSEESPTLFTRLNLDGHFRELHQTITLVSNYLEQNNEYLPFLPELAVEKTKALRQLKSSGAALRFIDRFVNRWDGRILEPQRNSLKLARGYALFDMLEFDSAVKVLEACHRTFDEIAPIGSEAEPFEICQRLTVIYWKTRRPGADLDYLASLSTTPNDKPDLLLTEGVLHGKRVSNRWLNEVETILYEIKKIEPLLSLRYERHTLAELFHIATKVFGARGRKAAAVRAKSYSESYFSLPGASRKLEVWDI